MELNYISKWGATLSLFNNELFYLTNVDGMTAVATDISSIVIGGIDGDSINNMQAQPRGIVMDFRIKSGVNVEDAKRAVLSVIKLKQSCTLIWTQNNRSLQIQGVVDNIEMPRFNNQVTMQVSIHCSQPFWEDVSQIVNEISEALPLHWFTDTEGEMLYFVDTGIPLGELDTSRTRTFVNAGDVAIGMTIEVLAYSTVTNPIIYDQNNNFFGVGYGTKSLVMNAGDVLTICTVKGQKSVTLNGTNLLDKVKPQSTWLQLEAGQNEFSIDSDDSAIDNMTFTLNYTQRYV
jgi:hypothetical protein